jgi:ubiquinone/menaquinone biosynthesis C-methylase UbiE
VLILFRPQSPGSVEHVPTLRPAPALPKATARLDRASESTDILRRVARVDYTGRAEDYRAGRTPPAGVLRSWAQTLVALDLPEPDRVLDVGAGPGGFLDPLAEWSGAPVVAVEPSASMRAEAVASGHAARFDFVAASAERLAIRSASVDWVWLSTVVHQFEDPRVAAAEVGRVLRRSGVVLVRGFFADVPITGLLARFPGIERSAMTFPSSASVVSWFEHAGLAKRAVRDVVEPWVFDMQSWVGHVRRLKDTDSALRPLTDEEVDEGIERVMAEHGPEATDVASRGTIRLIVFGQSAAGASPTSRAKPRHRQ